MPPKRASKTNYAMRIRKQENTRKRKERIRKKKMKKYPTSCQSN